MFRSGFLYFFLGHGARHLSGPRNLNVQEVLVCVLKRGRSRHIYKIRQVRQENVKLLNRA